MKVKGIIDTDFINYSKPCFYIAFNTCTFKCGKENCQNYPARNDPDIELSYETIYQRYAANDIAKCVVCGGFEPMDSFANLTGLIKTFRQAHGDESDFIIYTGYNKEEILPLVESLKEFQNIYMKYGRYIPNDTPIFDEVLKIELVSANQYGERIS